MPLAGPKAHPYKSFTHFVASFSRNFSPHSAPAANAFKGQSLHGVLVSVSLGPTYTGGSPIPRKPSNPVPPPPVNNPPNPPPITLPLPPQPPLTFWTTTGVP